MKTYEELHEVAKEIVDILKRENCSDYDYYIMFNLIMRFPLLIEEGAIWDGEFYESVDELPDRGKKELYERYRYDFDYK